MQRGGLTSDTSASITFAVGPAGTAPLIYASAATVAAISEMATDRIQIEPAGVTAEDSWNAPDKHGTVEAWNSARRMENDVES